jgi:hypothetical protein
MSVSTISAILVLLIFLLMFVTPIIIAIVKRGSYRKPKLLSYIILSLFIINWMLFGFNVYSGSFAEHLFIPIWMVLCIVGVISGVIELRNNKIFSLPLFGLTIIAIFFTMVASFLSGM